MDRLELQRLRDLPIEGVAERLGLRVVRHKTLCPFHDDHHASLSFKNNRWRCWSCGEGGDAISLVMKYLHKDFREACRWLNDSPLTPPCEGGEWSLHQQLSTPSPHRGGQGVESFARFFEHPWLSDEARRFLFDERRIDPRVVAWCRLSSWKDWRGVPWLQTPYFDREGRLVGLQNRNLVRGGLPRFRFPQGAECGIYNLPVLNLLRPGEALYVAEGCSDCWSLLSAGHKAIAIPSATLLSRKDVGVLEGLSQTLGTQFHMYPDADAPGERLFLQLRQVLPSLCRHPLPPGCKDYSDLYLRTHQTPG
ncbi:MAG: hypothetical protein IJ588_03105 [Prevotella sp.]|nr:hypothetical protein [Prevotella sp.]MBR1755860.1 hypothetical protein [Bacteroidaceae bacterium]